MKKTIVAVGGAGFSALNPTPTFNRYFLSLTGVSRPKIAYIPTATGDSAERIAQWLSVTAQYECDPVIISVYAPDDKNLAEVALSCNAIWVGGGNTLNMLHLWNLWGLDTALREAYEKGIVLGGVSAGGNCWFEQCSTDSYGPTLKVMPAMGVLPGSFCPHYDEEVERRPTLKRFLESGELKPGWAVDAMTGAVFVDGEYSHGVSANSTGAVYRVGLDAHGLMTEERLEPIRL